MEQTNRTSRLIVEEPNAAKDAEQKAKMQAIMGGAEEEFCLLNWLKLLVLFIFTYGLIVLIWVLCSLIETMKFNDGRRSVLASYIDGGGLLLGLFCFYILAFGVAWFFGSRQRDRIRRQVVQKQLDRQRAMQALVFDQ